MHIPIVVVTASLSAVIGALVARTKSHSLPVTLGIATAVGALVGTAVILLRSGRLWFL